MCGTNGSPSLPLPPSLSAFSLSLSSSVIPTTTATATMTRTTVSRGNRTAGRSRRCNGANPFLAPAPGELHREVTFPSVGGGKLSLRDALSRARCAHCSVYRCNLLFNPRIRVCRIVLPAPPRRPLFAARHPPLRRRRCGAVIRLHLQPPTCAIPSAIGNSQRRGVGALSRPPFALLSVAPRQSTPPPRVYPSLLPHQLPTILIASLFSFSSWILLAKIRSSRELNGERIARRTRGKESTIRAA